MSQTIVPDMVEKSLDVVFEEIERSGDSPTTGEMRELLSGCQMAGNSLDELWRLVGSTLDHGMERKSLTAFVARCLYVFEQGIKALHMVSERAARTNLSPEDKRSIAAFPEIVNRWTKSRNDLKNLLHWLEVPRPITIPASLHNRKHDPDFEGYIDLQDLERKMLAKET